ncbi:MAG: RraA family protein [Spirochaetia bacterium]
MKEYVRTASELQLLRKLSVPTLANALETFKVTRPNEGCCDPSIQCRFPALPIMIGYAVTSKVTTDQPMGKFMRGIDEHEYWDFVAQLSGPKIAVCRDIDEPPLGAMWGEFNSNVHKALGCEGAIVDGAVRDLDGVEQLGFRFFSRHVHPSHGTGLFVDYGGPVRVGGLDIATGDLLAADRHGILRIPDSVSLKELAEVATEIDRLESEVFSFCKSASFSVEGLKSLDASVMKRWPDPLRGQAPQEQRHH